MALLMDVNLRQKQEAHSSFWFARNAKPLVFVVITLALVGAYLASTIPVSVFPSTDFPRVVVGIDNGVMPIDQMMVTITRPTSFVLSYRMSRGTPPKYSNARTCASRNASVVSAG